MLVSHHSLLTSSACGSFPQCRCSSTALDRRETNDRDPENHCPPVGLTTRVLRLTFFPPRRTPFPSPGSSGNIRRPRRRCANEKDLLPAAATRPYFFEERLWCGLSAPYRSRAAGGSWQRLALEAAESCERARMNPSARLRSIAIAWQSPWPRSSYTGNRAMGSPIHRRCSRRKLPESRPNRERAHLRWEAHEAREADAAGAQIESTSSASAHSR